MDADEAVTIINQLVSLPLLRLRPPKELVILDAIIKPKNPEAHHLIIGRAHIQEELVALTPWSTVNTVVHEVLHINGVYDEFVVDKLSRLVQRRMEMAIIPKLFPRQLKYKQSSFNHAVLLNRLRLSAYPSNAQVQVKYYVLDED